METLKMKKVLIVLDYDSNAQIIAEFGFSLAKTMGAEIILMHVMLDLVYYSLTFMNKGPLRLDTIEGLKEAAQQFLDKTKYHLGDKNIKTIVKEGNIAQSILKTAKELKADIIVMGSHSKKWLENIVMGSVTEDVLRDNSIPLLIIPTKQKYENTYSIKRRKIFRHSFSN